MSKRSRIVAFLLFYVVLAVLGCSRETVDSDVDSRPRNIAESPANGSVGGPTEPLPEITGYATPSEVDASAEGSGVLRALLIGCGVYPHLSKDYQLQGPPNDVAITRELIQSERFGVKPEDIMILVSGSDPEREPTGVNIRAAFEQMCSVVRPGDQVLILLAGHGCQVPNNNPEGDPEPDGLDEAFVPADISAWDARNPPRAKELILDDEIGVWLDRMTAAGTRVFLVADCCHAGSIDRGAGEPPTWFRERRLPPIFAASSNEVRDESSNPTEEQLDWEVPPGVVSVFAVPSKFAELEDRMPPNSTGGVETVHGRLTFALNQVLRQARRPLTYRELIQQLGWQYLAWNWNPRPYLTGPDLDREVLGRRDWPTRSWVTATKEFSSYRLNVGSLDQIAVGSIFELFPVSGAEEKNQGIAYLKVVRVLAGESLAEVCEYDGRSKPDIESLPLGGNAELVYRELGDARLPVALIAANEEIPNPELWSACENALAKIIGDSRRLVRKPHQDETPQLFVVVGEGQAWVQQGSGKVEGFPDSGSVAYATMLNDPNLERTLAGGLTMISRAINLVRLANPFESNSSTSAPTTRLQIPPLLDIQVLRENPVNSGIFAPVEDLTNLVLDDGERVRVQVQNRSERSLDLTGLVVESGFKINSINLGRNGSKIARRLPPQSEPAYFGIKINNESFGLDHFVLIVVESGPDSQPADFSYLQQEGPDQARVLVKPQDRSSERPSRFQQLIESSLLDGAVTRGPGRTDEPGVVLRFPWRVLPPGKSTESK